MTQPRHKAIFLSYDGFGQSYLETLYLPILGSVENPPIDFTLVQFMPADHPQKPSDRAAAERLGIKTHFLNYRNKPPLVGTLYLIIEGILKVGRIARREKTDFVHARTHFPGLIALGAAKLFRPQMKLIYDMDGFVPEYRVESGLLVEKGFIFKTLKRIEKLLVEKSDLILVRTESAKKILRGWYGEAAAAKIFVTPNGKDEDFYRPSSETENREIRRKYGLDEKSVFIIYVGTLGKLFLPDKMLRLFSHVKKQQPNSFFLILTGTNFEPLNRLAQSEGLTERQDYAVARVSGAEIPSYISAADAGISFRAPTLSMRGISPLKVCEYLLCGTPAIVNASIGDLDVLFKENKELGFLLDETDEESLKRAARWILETAKPSRDRLRETARKGGVEEFGLSKIRKLYEEVYGRLVGR